jgi:hypothetical protein
MRERETQVRIWRALPPGLQAAIRAHPVRRDTGPAVAVPAAGAGDEYGADGEEDGAVVVGARPGPQ